MRLAIATFSKVFIKGSLGIEKGKIHLVGNGEEARKKYDELAPQKKHVPLVIIAETRDRNPAYQFPEVCLFQWLPFGSPLISRLRFASVPLQGHTALKINGSVSNTRRDINRT